jgi:hypothetical protein
MNDATDLLSLADAIAEIARTTTDAATGRRLMALLTSILEAAGLPSDEGFDSRVLVTGGWGAASSQH